ncbi:MAG: hypothetical protein K6G36_01480 [Candidatus Saccharibacteria bacterium]|nr:hypothetical protein [Candidatus Saccharibacteria bacterium]
MKKIPDFAIKREISSKAPLISGIREVIFIIIVLISGKSATIGSRSLFPKNKKNSILGNTC